MHTLFNEYDVLKRGKLFLNLNLSPRNVYNKLFSLRLESDFIYLVIYDVHNKIYGSSVFG